MAGKLHIPCVAALVLAGGVYLGAGVYVIAKAHLAQHLLDRAWTQTRDTGRHTAPWPWADSHPLARLEFPRLNIGLIVLAGASGRNLAFAPGHVNGSAAPGRPGASVIAGHRDTHFRFLRKLVTGDRILIHLPTGAVSPYRVIGHEVLDTRNGELRLDPLASILVLVTCYPFEQINPGGPLRYLVFATPEAVEDGAQQ